MLEKFDLAETLTNADTRLVLALKTFLLLMPFIVKLAPFVRPVVSRAQRVTRRRRSKRPARNDSQFED